MGYQRGYAQIAIHNGEAYELDNLEKTELEDRLDVAKLDDPDDPKFQDVVYRYLLELGYDVEPPKRSKPTKARGKAPPIPHTAREVWTKDRILKERAQVLRERERLLDARERLWIDSQRPRNSDDAPPKWDAGAIAFFLGVAIVLTALISNC